MSECFNCGRELRLDGEPIRNVDYVQVGDKKMCVDCWSKAVRDSMLNMTITDIRPIFEAHNYGWMFDEMIHEACSQEELHKLLAECVLAQNVAPIINAYIRGYIASEIGSLNRIISRGLARDLIEGDSINKGEEK